MKDVDDVISINLGNFTDPYIILDLGDFFERKYLFELSEKCHEYGMKKFADPKVNRDFQYNYNKVKKYSGKEEFTSCEKELKLLYDHDESNIGKTINGFEVIEEVPINSLRKLHEEACHLLRKIMSVFKSKSKPNESLKIFDNITKNAFHTDSLFNLAKLSYAENYSVSEFFVKLLLDVDPKYEAANNILSLIHQKNEKFVLGEKYMLREIKLHKNYLNLRNLALLYYTINKNNKSKKCYLECYKLSDEKKHRSIVLDRLIKLNNISMSKPDEASKWTRKKNKE